MIRRFVVRHGRNAARPAALAGSQVNGDGKPTRHACVKVLDSGYTGPSLRPRVPSARRPGGWLFVD